MLLMNRKEFLKKLRRNRRYGESVLTLHLESMRTYVKCFSLKRSSLMRSCLNLLNVLKVLLGIRNAFLMIPNILKLLLQLHLEDEMPIEAEAVVVEVVVFKRGTLNASFVVLLNIGLIVVQTAVSPNGDLEDAAEVSSEASFEDAEVLPSLIVEQLALGLVSMTVMKLAIMVN